MAACLITGATGFVGSHLAEACVGRGTAVQALVRPGSDASALEKLGVRIIRGQATDATALRDAVHGVDTVFHCAAKVGDWGPVDDYRAVNVEGTRLLLDACRAASTRRFVHLSSLGVYAARHHYATEETEPLPEVHIDGYTQSKVESEQLALKYHQLHGVPVVVLRPGFIYGPRDKTVLPRLLDALRKKHMRYIGIGGGRRAMNTIYVGNLVEAMFLAAEKPGIEGHVYNLTDGEPTSKRRFLTALADGVGVPRPRPLPAPLWLAKGLAAWQESAARRRGATTAPTLTRARVKFLGFNLDFNIEKARRELGYRPSTSFDEAMRITTAWYKRQP